MDEVKKVKCVLHNKHTAPVGVYNAEGACVYVPAGGSAEVELTEGEAAALIRSNTHLTVKRGGSGSGEVKEPPAPDLENLNPNPDLEGDDADDKGKKKAKGR